MSDGFENCLRCRVLTEKKISFFSAHQGKTHLVISIGMEALAKGYQTYFVTARDLVTQLRRGGQKVGEKASCLCEANCSHDRWNGVPKTGSEQRSLLISSDHPAVRAYPNKSSREWGEIVGDSDDVRSIAASFHYLKRGKLSITGKEDPKKKNKGFHEIFLGNVKPAILGKI